ncbi:efflux RND transporter periplasmic adaptor subunit [Telluribacter sp.]|jgi:Cu(I)/Ag(I) efflux system membrane fusion protein|uniref:efflux RND transporter periplasmic adaptor subunit n=1 Tax=Telluribacter sp. TaxID=1978767 RepID=UPI002E13965A|nr:efflux RND transporter periplasmic adaptor subunit [Telluribacter sp.]
MMKAINIPFLFVSIVLASSCNNEEADKGEAAGGQSYTCPMHPQIVQNEPGTCPICGMDLVPTEKNNEEASLRLSERQRLLANVTTDTVRTGAFSSIRQLNGRLAINPEQIEYVSSRVPGRIEDLYVREAGVPVRKGQVLYRIYSEQLAALQQEYLVATAQAEQFPNDSRFQQIAEAAKQRLMLYDQKETQLLELRNSRKTSPYVNYASPVSGVVAELFVTQGQYVSEGGSIMRIEGYQSVWVEVDVYPTEAGLIKKGQVVQVTVAGYENEQQKMRIDFLAPALQPGSQLLTIRGKIQNPNNRYRPGMQVFVEVPVSTTSEALTLPVDAVIRDGEGTHVWLETKPNIFEARTVKTGTENFSRVEITEGLQAGDVAVITGAYLLYSEFVLKKGKTPAGEHNH